MPRHARASERRERRPTPRHYVVHVHWWPGREDGHMCAHTWTLPPGVRAKPIYVVQFAGPNLAPPLVLPAALRRAYRAYRKRQVEAEPHPENVVPLDGPVARRIRELRPPETWPVQPGEPAPRLSRIYRVHGIRSGIFTSADGEPVPRYGLDPGDPGYQAIKKRVDEEVKRRRRDWEPELYDPRTGRWPTCFEAVRLDYNKRAGRLLPAPPHLLHGAPKDLVRVADEIYKFFCWPRLNQEIPDLLPQQIFRRLLERFLTIGVRLPSVPGIEDRVVDLINQCSRGLQTPSHRAVDKLVVALTAVIVRRSERTVQRWVRVKNGSFSFGRFHTSRP